jgi:LysR family transcriptional regulator, nitrogen assimilation regulatory protein
VSPCRIEPTFSLRAVLHITLLAFAEAGHGVAIIPSAMRTDRYELQVERIMHQRKTLLEPLAVVWGQRQPLSRYVLISSRAAKP